VPYPPQHTGWRIFGEPHICFSPIGPSERTEGLAGEKHISVAIGRDSIPKIAQTCPELFFPEQRAPAGVLGEPSIHFPPSGTGEGTICASGDKNISLAVGRHTRRVIVAPCPELPYPNKPARAGVLGEPGICFPSIVPAQRTGGVSCGKDIPAAVDRYITASIFVRRSALPRPEQHPSWGILGEPHI
jgi:hypothetical protein